MRFRELRTPRDRQGVWVESRWTTEIDARAFAEALIQTRRGDQEFLPDAWEAIIYDTGPEEKSTGPMISYPGQYDVLRIAREAGRGQFHVDGLGRMASAIVSQNGKYQMRNLQPWELGVLPSEREVRGEVIWIGERMPNYRGGDNYYIVGTETRLHDADPYGLVNYLQDRGIDARMVRMNDGSVAIKRKDVGGPLIPEVREEMLETFGLGAWSYLPERDDQFLLHASSLKSNSGRRLTAGERFDRAMGMDHARMSPKGIRMYERELREMISDGHATPGGVYSSEPYSEDEVTQLKRKYMVVTGEPNDPYQMREDILEMEGVGVGFYGRRMIPVMPGPFNEPKPKTVLDLWLSFVGDGDVDGNPTMIRDFYDELGKRNPVLRRTMVGDGDVEGEPFSEHVDDWGDEVIDTYKLTKG